MKIRTAIRLSGFVLVMTAMQVVSLQAQAIKNRMGPAKIWFIARVVSTEPFMLEYVDDWYRHQPEGSDEYDLTTDTNPQARTEDVSKFKLGDIIGGEFCSPHFDNCPPPVNVWQPGEELSFPPPIAIHLRRLGSGYKYKYRNKGLLVSYRRNYKNIITGLSIFRDGTIDLGSFDAGGLRRRLAKSELDAVEKAFFAKGTDKIESTKRTGDYLTVGLITIFGKYRDLRVDESSKKEVPFFSFLDDLIEKQMRTAIYRINYMWRYQIKDWKYGDTLPLDQAIDRKYRFDHWDALAKVKVPSELWNEARERYGNVIPYYYRYKGGLYSIQFGTCTDGSTGTFACYLAAGGGKPVADGRIWGVFEEWPKELQTKLKNIPPNGAMVNANGYSNGFGKGLQIPRSDIERHSDFFKRLLNGGASYREGEYIYAGLKVWFH